MGDRAVRPPRLRKRSGLSGGREPTAAVDLGYYDRRYVRGKRSRRTQFVQEFPVHFEHRGIAFPRDSTDGIALGGDEGSKTVLGTSANEFFPLRVPLGFYLQNGRSDPVSKPLPPSLYQNGGYDADQRNEQQAPDRGGDRFPSALRRVYLLVR
jgi:hypothetical protein